MAELEALKRLEEACRDTMRDIREIELKRDNLTNDIASLESNKKNLSDEVEGLGGKVEEARNKVIEERKTQIQQIEEKLQKASELQAGLEMDRTRLAEKENEVNKIREKLEYQVSENNRLNEELLTKNKVVDDKLAQIDSFKTTIAN